MVWSRLLCPPRRGGIPHKTDEHAGQLRAMAAVVAHERARQPGEREARADLEQQPSRAAAVNAYHDAADADPESASDCGAEEHDHVRVVPRLAARAPQCVIRGEE